jgi:sigma-B regulation protein RsbU (phosphoserine phosphatase)
MAESIKQTKTDSPESAIEIQLELGIKKAQLKWLLQVTHAINYNFSNQQLLDIFEKVMKEECRLSHYTLFYFFNGKWKCMLSYPGDEKTKALSEKILSHLNTNGNFDSNAFKEWSEVFEILTPVTHEKHQLAYLFTSGYGQNGRRSRNEMLKFVETITNLIVVAMENNNFKRIREEQIAMKAELNMAAQLQKLLIPERLPVSEHFESQDFYLPHAEIGGDYYDFIQTGESEYVFCIADVMGKGMAAAMLMANFQANLHALLLQKLPLTTLIRELNNRMFKLTRGERYITFFIGRFDTKTRELHYFNAGHPPPVLVHMNVPLKLNSGSTFLGTFPELPEMKAGKTILPSPGLILCYTDGIIDARNSQDEPFGTERVFDFLFSGIHKMPLSELHTTLLQKLDVFRGAEPHHDDITMLTLRFR